MGEGQAEKPRGVGVAVPCCGVSLSVCPLPLQKLLKISEQSWSLAELVHAVVLLAHCHALASFVFGCGCGQDERPDGRAVPAPTSPGNQCFCEAGSGNGCSQELLRINRKRVSPGQPPCTHPTHTRGLGIHGAALIPLSPPAQSLDSCVELESLRDRAQKIHPEAEGREETRLPQPDREEGERGRPEPSSRESREQPMGADPCLPPHGREGSVAANPT